MLIGLEMCIQQLQCFNEIQILDDQEVSYSILQSLLFNFVKRIIEMEVFSPKYIGKYSPLLEIKLKYSNKVYFPMEHIFQ